MKITALATSSTGNEIQVAPTTKGADPLADKTTFLKLLVAQIKNQNPLNPQDGAQFLAQLAQFSQVEQLVGIRQDLDDLKKASFPTPAISK